jgi:hypothetical protein
MQFADRQKSVARAVLPPCIVIAVTCVLFLPSLGNQFLPFDDALYVTENAYVQRGITPETVAWAFTSGHAANWHPVTWLSHMADVSLFGLDPRGHHGTSVLLHAINSALVYLFCARFARWQAALTVALIFGIHPLHVESVSWVSSRKDLLCAFFWFI